MIAVQMRDKDADQAVYGKPGTLNLQLCAFPAIEQPSLALTHHRRRAHIAVQRRFSRTRTQRNNFHYRLQTSDLRPQS
jgi:hypothetical protein